NRSRDRAVEARHLAIEFLLGGAVGGSQAGGPIGYYVEALSCAQFGGRSIHLLKEADRIFARQHQRALAPNRAKADPLLLLFGFRRRKVAQVPGQAMETLFNTRVDSPDRRARFVVEHRVSLGLRLFGFGA